MATKTVSTGWSDGDSNFGSIFSDSGGDKYYSMPISTVNTAIKNAGIPANAVISSVSLTATATIENSMAGRFYLSIGFGGSGSISTTLLNGAQIAYDKMSGSTTQTVSLNAALSNNSINTSKGSYITFRIYSTNWGKKTYKVKDVNLTITYSIPTYTLTVTAGAGGTVTGGGTYNNQATATLKATPALGYKFKQWSDGNTSATRTVTVTGNATYTAEFEPITYSMVFDSNGGSSIYDDKEPMDTLYTTSMQLGSYGFNSPYVKYTYDANGGKLSGNASSVSYPRPLLGWEDLGSIVDPGGTLYTADTFDAPYYANKHPDLYAAFGYDKYALISHYYFNGKKEGRPVINTEGDKERGVYPAGAEVSHLSNIDGATVTLRCQWGTITENLFDEPTRDGYEFLGWSDGTTLYAAGEAVTSKVDKTFTAQWKSLKVNKIYVGTSQPKEIYVGTSPVKAIYVGTTKVYG